AVGGRDQPEVDGDQLAAADPHDLPFLEHPQQLDLELGVQLADLIEEQGAAVGELELADLARHRAGEGTALVAEQLALEDVAGNGAAVDGQEAFVTAGARPVQRVGHQFLAGAAVADDEHAGAGGSHQPHLLEEVLHGRRAADDALEAVALVEHLAQGRDLLLELLLLDQVHHPLAQLVEIDRLGEVVVGADPHGLHRGLDGAVGGHQHDAEVDLPLPHLLQEAQAVHAGHPQIADGEAGVVVLVEEFQRLLRVVEGAHGEPRLLEGDRHRFAGAGFVVDDQNQGLLRHEVILAQTGVGVEETESCRRLKLPEAMTLPLDPQDTRDAATTLEGALDRIVFTNEENAWSVVRLTVPGHRDLVTAVGNLLGVQPGENLRLTGTWINDPKFGKQFRVTSYATVVPATVGGIEKYLGSGLIRGIGKVMASRLVKAFGLETLEVIENRPTRLTEVEGIGPKRSREILRAWTEQREIKEVMIFLQSHGVSTHYAIKIYKTYGPLATKLVRENPYRLAADVYGIGFKTADKIAAALGVPPDAPQRIEAGTLYLLGEGANRGHLYLPRQALVEDAEKLLAAPADRVGQAV